MPTDGAPRDPDAAAAEVCSLLSDETRCAIVRELAQRSTEQWNRGYVSYAELRRAVGVEDGGQFNYHLDRLRDRLVTRDGDRYCLTLEGTFVARALFRGTIGGGGSIEGEAFECPWCGRPLTGSCRNGLVEATCEDHGTVFDMVVPPSVTDFHDVETVLLLALRRVAWYNELAMHGACHECWGPVEAEAPVRAEETRYDETDALLIEFHCRGCDHTFWLPPGVCLYRHPAVVSFCWDHGQDLLGDVRFYDFASVSYPLVEATDRGLALTIVRGDEQLRVELDGDAEVVETERGPATEERPEWPPGA